MSRVIIPAGLSMGPRYRYVRPADPTPECYEIHLGDDLVELTETEAAVWAASFVDTERHAKLEVNRESLIRLLETAPRPEPDAAQLVDDLIGRGLLVEFDTDGDLEPVFRRHKLLPLGQGLGSTPDEPHLHRVGLANQPILALPNDVYLQWSFSYLHSSLWDACVYYADDSEHIAEGGDPLGVTPHSLAREIAGNVPLLVATGCGFIDPVAIG
ncbi:hypothetical protein F8271_29680 [Micromonospora sp. ALFpr18c]|uniref:hypothetical protein n=1 Tax=Micromonospora sp. ALFpr18c TaxID=1458665 RepID=UPI00124AF805|nr:hypothetical protein [Micromonospora sp. ALFpr18c]KAB1927440.1 hypothetical protein F8271_29680 [Micromonospora sp. ALFpr18c]